MTILITRPRHDKETNYPYYWSSIVVKHVRKKKSLKLLDLASEKATRKALQQYLRKFTPSLFFLNGHGTSDAIFGHNDQPLITVGGDLSDFADGIFYCRSCKSALVLGLKLVEAGTRAFIGYNRNFAFAYMPRCITRPAIDPLAKLFLEPSNLVPISLIKGNTVSTSCRKSQAAMRANLRKMLSSKASYEERYYAQYLWSNIKSQTVIGDHQAAIS